LPNGENLKLALSFAEVQQLLMALRLWWAANFASSFNEDQLFVEALATIISTG
jgi:hypothetical protein